MGEFDFEEGPTHEEIWKKISSENVDEKLEGLIEAASEKANTESDPEGALAYLEAARDIVVASDDPTGIAFVFMLLGMTYYRLGDYAAAAAAYDASAEGAKRGMKTELEVDSLVAAARSYRKLRDFGSMRRNFEIALALADECSHNYRSAMKAEYGRYLRKIGDPQAARVYLEQAYADEPPGPSARAAKELVRLMLAEGDVSGALTRAQEAYAASSYMNDSRGLNSSQYLLASALVAAGDADAAIRELEELRSRQTFGQVKHKVRVDVLYAEALMKKGDWEVALPLLAKAIPMLRREKLFVDLGKACLLRSECHGVLSQLEDCANDLVQAVDAFAEGNELGGMCSALLELAHMSVSKGDWETAGIYAHRVVDQVLMSFTPVYNQALGIFAVAKAKAGDVVAAGELVERLGELKGLSGIELAHKLHASALMASGIRQRNLAAKAVKEYLLRNREWMCKDLVPLM